MFPGRVWQRSGFDDCRKASLELFDHRRELRVAGSQGKRRPKSCKRFRRAPIPPVQLPHLALCREVLRRRAKGDLQLALRVAELPHGQQRASERHASGMIFGMMAEARAADPYGFRVFTGPAVFLRELCEDQGRGVFLNPPPKLLEA